jgi:hypothetical protein
MVSESEDLHQALGAENHDEDRVEDVQQHGEALCLLIVVHCHGQHVKPNEQHDDHVELLVCHDFKHYCLRSPLKVETLIKYLVTMDVT